MRRFDTLLDAASRLLRDGYEFQHTFEDRFGKVEHHFGRHSWSAVIVMQKNGKVRVERF